MAADAYIQSAITQLHSAINDMQQQMNGLHQDADQQKRQLQQEIDHAENERRMVEVTLSTQQDDNQKHVLQDRINSLNRHMDEHRARMSQIDSDVANLNQRKTQAYNNLQGLVRQLDSMMASPDIR